MLSDNHNRTISYLRVSVTDRCNFRCRYCLPARGAKFADGGELLAFDEIRRVVRVAASLGLSKIRITGGEPTVRPRLPELIETLRQISGIGEIAMTTNAAKLSALAAPLRRAGLSRLNISLDTLRREKFAAMTRRDCFDDVMRGIEAAIDAGFENLKFNAVVVRGANDDELSALVEFARARAAQMRFIEYMPMGAARFDAGNKIVYAKELLRRLNENYDFAPVENNALDSDPASRFVCRKTGASVGFIASMSDHFCGSCSRMRLTATGGLRPCLHQNAEVDLKPILRGGEESDERLKQAFFDAANLKWAGHRMNDFVPIYSRKEMVAVGG